jgi:hypothetical protein
MGDHKHGHNCSGRISAAIQDGAVAITVIDCGGAGSTVAIQAQDAMRLGTDLQRFASGAAHGMSQPDPLGAPNVRAVAGAIVLLAGRVPVVALTPAAARKLVGDMQIALAADRPELAS